MWVDSHCHLDAIDQDLDKAIASATEAGVDAIITAGEDLQSSEVCVRMAERFESVWAAVGVHPHRAALIDKLALLKFTHHSRVVAIGEIGLDFYRDHTPRGLQIEVFEAQLEIARDTGLPAVIHVRDSFDEVVASLRKFPEVRPVFHCFTGNAEQAEQAVNLGGVISFAGIISYRKSADLRAVAATIPEDRILVETDSPYLTPEPHRGKPNEPANVLWTGVALASVLGIEVDELARITSCNAMRAFPKLSLKVV